MSIKVIVELQAKPGKRAEVQNLLESVAASLGPGTPGFLGSTCYEVLDNPDIVVEIADWESAQVRVAAMQEAVAGGVYSPLVALLASPFRVIVIGALPRYCRDTAAILPRCCPDAALTGGWCHPHQPRQQRRTPQPGRCLAVRNCTRVDQC